MTKFRIENGVYNWIECRIGVSQPCKDLKINEEQKKSDNWDIFSGNIIGVICDHFFTSEKYVNPPLPIHGLES